MNRQTQDLIEQINQKIRNSKYFFFSKEAERGIGLEDYLENYQIICGNADGISRMSKAKVLDSKSSTELFNSDYIRSQTHEKAYYAESFYHSSALQYKILNSKGVLLNPDASISKFYENKLNLNTFLNSLGILTPKSHNTSITRANLESIKLPFVVQLSKSHTGIGTFIITQNEDLNKIIELYEGTDCKVSEYIDGITITLNACITNLDVYTNGLQYQITGMLPMTNSSSTTVGNDFSLGSSLIQEYGSDLSEIMIKIGNSLRLKGFYGLFGIDAIIQDKKIYVIEINARQTANIAMQTQLELASDMVPLKLIHIAHFLGIQTNNLNVSLNALNGSQIFLRSRKDNFELTKQFATGVYRLMGDNSAIEWEGGKPRNILENTIFLDETQDKPLVFQYPAYRIDKIKDLGVLILTQNKGNIRNNTEELIRFQLKDGIVNNGKISQWIVEALNSIYNSLL